MAFRILENPRNLFPFRNSKVLKESSALTSLWVEADENGVYDYEGSIYQLTCGDTNLNSEEA
jgi:hypothetical protein